MYVGLPTIRPRSHDTILVPDPLSLNVIHISTPKKTIRSTYQYVWILDNEDRTYLIFRILTSDCLLFYSIFRPPCRHPSSPTHTTPMAITMVRTTQNFGILLAHAQGTFPQLAVRQTSLSAIVGSENCRASKKFENFELTSTSHSELASELRYLPPPSSDPRCYHLHRWIIRDG